MAKRSDWKEPYRELTGGQLLDLLKDLHERHIDKVQRMRSLLTIIRDKPDAVKVLTEQINEAAGLTEAPMSEQKEPAIIGRMYSVEQELSEGYEVELCDESSWVIARLSGPFQKKQAERICDCVNACLSMSDPEADVRALVSGNRCALLVLQELRCEVGQKRQAQIDMTIEVINQALARLRREP